MNTQTKTYYAGNETGEVVCADCAGIQLKASIKNARPGQMQNFYGAQEMFYTMGARDIAELVSLVGDVICACEVK